MERDYTTTGERVQWALDHSGRTANDVAEEIGCSHSAISLWVHNRTNLDNAKVALLLKFCRATGTSVEWLLTGEGPRESPTALAKASPLVARAQRIHNDQPSLETIALRLLDAIIVPPEGPPPQAQH